MNRLARREIKEEIKPFKGRLEWVTGSVCDNSGLSLNPNEFVLPLGAVAGGVTHTGVVTYIARIPIRSRCRDHALAYGAYIPSRNTVSIPYGSSGHMSINTADILVCHDPEILYWVNASNGDVPDNAITINKSRDANNCVYIARTRPNTPLTGLKSVDSKEIVISDQFKGPMLGKLHAIDHTMYLDYKGSVYKVPHYQVLCAYVPPPVQYLISSPYSWVPASDGYVPENALVGGLTKDGKHSYVAGVDYRGIFIIGYVVPSDKVCYFPGDRFATSSNSYRVLIPSNPSDFSWNVLGPGFDAGNANLVHAKNEPSDSTPESVIFNYVGRTKPGFERLCHSALLGRLSNDRLYESQGNIQSCQLEYPKTIQAVGTVVSNAILAISYENDILQFIEYEALFVGKIINSLQELCRYAILEYTFGVPDRINSLPLPTKMKEFCQLRPNESHKIHID